MHENREIPFPPPGNGTGGRAGKVHFRKPAMNENGKSDRPVVPMRRPNKAGEPAAEAVEGRGLTKENASQQNTPRTQSRTEGVPSALERVRQAAKRNRKERFSALLHHVDRLRLEDAFYSLNEKASPGIDGMTWRKYGENLEANLRDLHDRVQRGAYRPKPSRRAYIPKPDGRQRPLGIAALEDKILQRAVTEVLNAIYEVDFLGFSYGFRPGRQAHQALDALTVGIRQRKINWILDADIRGYFDAIDHDWMMRFLEHRIADGRVLTLIRRWLKAGVVEDGAWEASEVGSPQGSSISPLLANVYLHYALDLWVQWWRDHEAQGDVIIVRYADDFVIGFQHEAEAKRFLEELRARLEKFSLELHPEKTRLIRFGHDARSDSRRIDGKRKPETFDFLGFTHRCGVTRKGAFQVWRTTTKKRFRARLRAIKEELWRRMHEPVREQASWLRSVIQGYFAYHAIPGNFEVLAAFRRILTRIWYRTLMRRSQKHRLLWPRMGRLRDRWFPRARILHPWPEQRLAAMIQGKSRMR
jgi:group II intron reverse transcriptase/maturase